MEPTPIHKKNYFGIDVGSSPYISVKINAEAYREIQHKLLRIYQHQGQQLFELKHKDGHPTGEMVFFVVFE